MADTINPPHAPESAAGSEYIAQRRLARVYAEALLEVAEQRHQADEVGDELRALVDDVLKAHPQIGTLLASPSVRRTQREPLLRDTLAGKVSDTLLSFLLVLNRRNRLALLRSVRIAYYELLDARARRVRVQVRSAAELPEDQQQRLRDTLAAALHREPVLDVRVDPSLLGGLVVRVGDDVYDASVRTRIETIRNQLLARSSYEIQSGRDRFSHH